MSITTMIDPSVIERRHHTGLQAIRTRPDSPSVPRRASRQGSLVSLNSSPSLPSPSLVAARAFYLENPPPAGVSVDASQRRKSLNGTQDLPRRHSVLATTNSLEVQLESFSFLKGSRDLQTVPEVDDGVTKEIKVEAQERETSDLSMHDAERRDTLEGEIPRRDSNGICGKPEEVFCQVPFQYTHDHLRDWGYAYLGNSATADAFISPVSLRRPSLAITMGDGLEVKPAIELTTIRARVVPKGRDRKPFLIQRRFDIEELRSSIPKGPTSGSKSSSSSPAPSALRRSNRARRSSAYHTTASGPQATTSPTSPKSRSPGLGKGALPIRRFFDSKPQVLH